MNREPARDEDLARPPARSGSVLLASENPALAERIASALSRARLEVVVLSDTGSVLAHLREATGTDVLILDGTDRPWVAAAILEGLRQSTDTPSIIVLTGADSELRAAADDLDVAAVLGTPVNVERLVVEAGRLVRAGSGQHSIARPSDSQSQD